MEMTSQPPCTEFASPRLQSSFTPAFHLIFMTSLETADSCPIAETRKQMLVKGPA